MLTTHKKASMPLVLATATAEAVAAATIQRKAQPK